MAPPPFPEDSAGKIKDYARETGQEAAIALIDKIRDWLGHPEVVMEGRDLGSGGQEHHQRLGRFPRHRTCRSRGLLGGSRVRLVQGVRHTSGERDRVDIRCHG